MLGYCKGAFLYFLLAWLALPFIYQISRHYYGRSAAFAALALGIFAPIHFNRALSQCLGANRYDDRPILLYPFNARATPQRRAHLQLLLWSGRGIGGRRPCLWWRLCLSLLRNSPCSAGHFTSTRQWLASEQLLVFLLWVAPLSVWYGLDITSFCPD